MRPAAVRLDEIVIDPVFKRAMPPLCAVEMTGLYNSIVAEGVRNPLVIWYDGDRPLLVDGHNRMHEFLRAREANPSLPDPPIVVLDLPDRQAVLHWIYGEHVNRRNLTAEQASEFRGLYYNYRKQAHGTNQHTGRSPQTEDSSSGHKPVARRAEKTSVAVAKELGVSRATIERDGDFAAGLAVLDQTEPDEAAAVRQGHSRLRKADVERMGKAARKMPAEQAANVASPVRKEGSHASPTTSAKKRLAKKGKQHADPALPAIVKLGLALAHGIKAARLAGEEMPPGVMADFASAIEVAYSAKSKSAVPDDIAAHAAEAAKHLKAAGSSKLFHRLKTGAVRTWFNTSGSLRLWLNALGDPSAEPEGGDVETATAETDCEPTQPHHPQYTARPANRHTAGNGRAGVGIFYASDAINCLKMIPPKDALRSRGFEMVEDYAKLNK